MVRCLGTAALALSLVEEDELQRVEIRRQDKQMINVAFAKSSDEVVTPFRRE